MFRRTDPTDAMWTRALDLMAEADRMHRQFFRLATSARPVPTWEPPADVFEDGPDVIVAVALPGVPAEAVEVVNEGGALVVRAERPQPFSRARLAVRQLEIPYGYFERRIALPPGRFEAVAHELAHGCLLLRLRKVD